MEGSPPEGRKAKKRKMELLEGWGLRTSPQEGNSTQEEEVTSPTKKWDWNDTHGSLIVEERRKETQTKITAWAEVKGTVLDEARRVPEGRKGEEEGTVQAGTGEGQEENINVPEGRKTEEAGNVPGGIEVEETVPEGRKVGKKEQPTKPPVRRVRGKLSKKEDKEMRRKYMSQP